MRKIKLSPIFPPLEEPKSREDAVSLAEAWELATKPVEDLCVGTARNRALYWKELVLLCEWTIDKARISNVWLPVAEHLFKMACEASLHGNEWGGDADFLRIMRVAWENDTTTILRELNIGVTRPPPPPVPTEEHPEPAPKPEWA